MHIYVQYTASELQFLGQFNKGDVMSTFSNIHIQHTTLACKTQTKLKKTEGEKGLKSLLRLNGLKIRFIF
jgi:hypothetical protein